MNPSWRGGGQVLSGPQHLFCIILHIHDGWGPLKVDGSLMWGQEMFLIVMFDHVGLLLHQLEFGFPPIDFDLLTPGV